MAVRNRPALIPVVTVLGLVVDAVFASDYPLVQGVVLLIALGFIASNLLVDLLYGLIDPRIRHR